MNGYQVYKLYKGIKLHFTDDNYDFFKYRGQTKTTAGQYERRKDKHAFERLSRHRDCLGFILANIIVDSDVWIGELSDNEICTKNYNKWKATIDSLSYVYNQQVPLVSEIVQSKTSKTKQLSQLIKLYMSHEVSLETLLLAKQIYPTLFGHTFTDDTITSLQPLPQLGLIEQHIIHVANRYEPFLLMLSPAAIEHGKKLLEKMQKLQIAC